MSISRFHFHSVVLGDVSAGALSHDEQDTSSQGDDVETYLSSGKFNFKN